jgi:hypothetical protein
MPIECVADRAPIVTHFTVEQSFLNEPVEFRFAYLEHHAAKALPPAFPVQAHAFGGWAWIANELVHGLLFRSLLRCCPQLMQTQLSPPPSGTTALPGCG